MFTMGPGFVKSGGGAGGGTTWNPADKGGFIALSNGNLTATPTGGTTYGLVRATTSKSSGKQYFEVHVDTTGTSNFGMIGVCAASTVINGGYPGVDANGWGYYEQTGNKFNNAVSSAFGATYAIGDVIGVAVDLSAGMIWFAKNNVWQASGNPAAGTSPAFSGLSGTLFPALGMYPAGPVLTARFLAAAQTYAPPSGFTAWG